MWELLGTGKEAPGPNMMSLHIPCTCWCLIFAKIMSCWNWSRVTGECSVIWAFATTLEVKYEPQYPQRQRQGTRRQSETKADRSSIISATIEFDSGMTMTTFMMEGGKGFGDVWRWVLSAWTEQRLWYRVRSWLFCYFWKTRAHSHILLYNKSVY